MITGTSIGERAKIFAWSGLIAVGLWGMVSLQAAPSNENQHRDQHRDQQGLLLKSLRDARPQVGERTPLSQEPHVAVGWRKTIDFGRPLKEHRDRENRKEKSALPE
jgi:hypothetical protein